MTVICLDLDGTLEDSRDDMVAAVTRVRASLGLPKRAPEGFRGHVNRGMPHLYRHCFEEITATDDAAVIADVASRYAADYGARIAEETRLYPGIAQAIERLGAIAPLALVTNKPQALSKLLLDALGVGDRFSAIIGGDTLPVHKPDPAMIGAAIERTGADRAVMIGDSAGDIRCARAHGSPVIWCAWGYADEPGPKAPDAVARTPSDLPGIVTRVLEDTRAAR